MTRIHKTFILTLLLFVASLLALSTQASTASAKMTFSVIGFDANYKKCSGSCRNFTVFAKSDDLKRVGSSGTICWLGNCRSNLVRTGDPVNFILADYKNVGPYRCGTPTTVSLNYQGRRYSGTTRIRC